MNVRRKLKSAGFNGRHSRNEDRRKTLTLKKTHINTKKKNRERLEHGTGNGRHPG